MTQAGPILNQSGLAEGFRQLGLREGLTAMVHSSLSSFGWVEGGAETVIKALLDVLGAGGTLVLPTLCLKEDRFETWDIRHSPSTVGRITETFRLWPGVLRSDHFSHSVAALGPLAEEITSGHATAYGRPSPWGPAAFGYGSPWGKFYELNVLYCFLGVNFRVNTLRHYSQSVLVEEALAQAPSTARERLAAQIPDWRKPGVWPYHDDEKMEARLAGLGLINYVQIGNAICRSIPARTQVDHTLEILRAEPAQWFDAGFMDWYDATLRR
jgi:aminoglycoside 3-N-acetyltransferase